MRSRVIQIGNASAEFISSAALKQIPTEIRKFPKFGEREERATAASMTNGFVCQLGRRV
jgi:hypothetical protein